MDTLSWLLGLTGALGLVWPVVRAVGLWRAQKRFALPNDLVAETLGLAYDPGISVVIAAHNEALNLPHLLEALAGQHYRGEFEVLVVDDRSTDATPEVLAQAQARYPWLRSVRIDATPEGWSPKKWALSQGIAAARYERLAFTDADCTPAPGWLAGIVAAYERGAEVVLGYAPLANDGSRTGDVQAVEAWLQATDNLALTALGQPITATGRSLAYTKAVYHRVGGYEAHKGVLSGDDDLLVTQRSRYGLLWYLLGLDTQVTSAAKTTPEAWHKARTRHIGAARHYPLRVWLLHALRQLSYWSGRGVRIGLYVGLWGVIFKDWPWVGLLLFWLLYDSVLGIVQQLEQQNSPLPRVGGVTKLPTTRRHALERRARAQEFWFGLRALLAPPTRWK